MSIAAPAVAEELIDLGVAAGLLHRTDDGITVNEAWFSDPASHLRSMLTDREQREALLGLARRALGTASAADIDRRCCESSTRRCGPSIRSARPARSTCPC